MEIRETYTKRNMERNTQDECFIHKRIYMLAGR